MNHEDYGKDDMHIQPRQIPSAYPNERIGFSPVPSWKLKSRMTGRPLGTGLFASDLLYSASEADVHKFQTHKSKIKRVEIKKPEKHEAVPAVPNSAGVKFVEGQHVQETKATVQTAGMNPGFAEGVAFGISSSSLLISISALVIGIRTLAIGRHTKTQIMELRKQFGLPDTEKKR